MSYIEYVCDLLVPGEEIGVVHVGGSVWMGEYVRHTEHVLTIRSDTKVSPVETAAIDHFINVAHIAGINVKAVEP